MPLRIGYLLSFVSIVYKTKDVVYGTKGNKTGGCTVLEQAFYSRERVLHMYLIVYVIC